MPECTLLHEVSPWSHSHSYFKDSSDAATMQSRCRISNGDITPLAERCRTSLGFFCFVFCFVF